MLRRCTHRGCWCDVALRRDGRAHGQAVPSPRASSSDEDLGRRVELARVAGVQFRFVAIPEPPPAAEAVRAPDCPRLAAGLCDINWRSMPKALRPLPVTGLADATVLLRAESGRPVLLTRAGEVIVAFAAPDPPPRARRYRRGYAAPLALLQLPFARRRLPGRRPDRTAIRRLRTRPDARPHLGVKPRSSSACSPAALLSAVSPGPPARVPTAAESLDWIHGGTLAARVRLPGSGEGARSTPTTAAWGRAGLRARCLDSSLSCRRWSSSSDPTSRCSPSSASTSSRFRKPTGCGAIWLAC